MEIRSSWEIVVSLFNSWLKSNHDVLLTYDTATSLKLIEERWKTLIMDCCDEILRRYNDLLKH